MHVSALWSSPPRLFPYGNLGSLLHFFIVLATFSLCSLDPGEHMKDV